MEKQADNPCQLRTSFPEVSRGNEDKEEWLTAAIPTTCEKIRKNVHLSRDTAQRRAYLLQRDEEVLKFRSKHGREPSKQEMEEMHYLSLIHI